MFEALSNERVRVQLCLTLAEGEDTICAYLAVSAGAWPVGMVPGFCTVQVRPTGLGAAMSASPLLLRRVVLLHCKCNDCCIVLLS